MDPSIVTDDYLAAIEDPHTRAVIRALRDYGMMATENAHGYNILYAEPGIPSTIIDSLRDWSQINGPDGQRMTRHLRRVAGAGPIHNPSESDWDAWRANGQGWGGGAPRVPYSPPLAPL